MINKTQKVYHRGNYAIFQDLSFEEQEDFWNDLEEKLKSYKKKQEDKLKNEITQNRW